MTTCNKDCFNCPYPDCIRDERQDDRDKCKKHYYKDIEASRKYHRDYQQKHYNTNGNTEKCRRWRENNLEKKKQYDHERYLKRKAERQAG